MAAVAAERQKRVSRQARPPSPRGSAPLVELPVVVVTAFAPDAPEADLRGLGGPTLRLRKPFDFDGLAAGVAAVRAAPAAPGAAPRRTRSYRVAAAT